MVITHDSSSLGAFLLLAINFQQPLFSLFLFFLLEQAADSSPDRYLDLTPAYRVPSLLCFYPPSHLFTPPACSLLLLWNRFFHLLFSPPLVQQEATGAFSSLLIISSLLNWLQNGLVSFSSSCSSSSPTSSLSPMGHRR